MIDGRPEQDSAPIPSNFIVQGDVVLMNVAAVHWAAQRGRRRPRSKRYSNDQATAILSHLVMPADENGRTVWKVDELRRWLHNRGRVPSEAVLRKWLIVLEQVGDIRVDWQGDEIAIELVDFDCEEYVRRIETIGESVSA